MMRGKVEAWGREATGRDFEDCVEEGALGLEFWALAMDCTAMWVLHCVTSVIPSLASVFLLIKWGIDLNTFWGSWLWNSKIKEEVIELEEKVESTSPRNKGIPGGEIAQAKIVSGSNWVFGETRPQDILSVEAIIKCRLNKLLSLSEQNFPFPELYFNH